MKIEKVSNEMKLFYFLIGLTLSLGSLNIALAKGYFIPELSVNTVKDDVINLNDLTLEQKIAQMIITHGGTHNLDVWKKMQLGGVHFFAMESEEVFKETINQFQDGMSIPFFITADLEGCLNPFSNFREFTAASEITTTEEAQKKGEEEGQFLKSMGFNLNFAPVVDLDDKIWMCRSFPGEEENVAELAKVYSSSLEEQGVSATAKHYPGKTLVVSDPHQNLVAAEISTEDIYPYNIMVQEDYVDLIMVSHIIVSGEIDSKGAPSTVSPEIILPLKEKYSGLIISDDTIMLGLQNFYEENTEQLYVDLVLAGNDIILNFNEDPNEIYFTITSIKEAVEQGIIEEENIDNSVIKILELKGFEVIR